jgi:hypothetical protein
MSESTNAVREDCDPVETCMSQLYNYLLAASNFLEAVLFLNVPRSVGMRRIQFSGSALADPENGKRTFSSRKMRFTFAI